MDVNGNKRSSPEVSDTETDSTTEVNKFDLNKKEYIVFQ
jgi:hypothetical protein